MSTLGIAMQTEEDIENVSESASEQPKKKRSMRAAINAYCKECTYDDAFRGGGTWREQTGACTVTKCPLWEFRPVSKPRKSTELELGVEVEDDEE